MNQTIHCQQVTKCFGKIKALDEVDICFEKGRITGLVGRNGAGKTTLLNVIANRMPVSRGQVLIDGEEGFEQDDAQQKLFYMSVANYYPEDCRVKKGFAIAKALLSNFDEQAALAYAKAFEVPLKQKIIKLSTGMQSLYKLCVALASNADYLLLDEPVLGLDVNNRDLFYRLLIEKVSETGCGIILSTHLIEEVATLLEKVVLIDHGRIVLASEVEDLLNHYYMISGEERQVRVWAQDRERISSRQLGQYLTWGLYGPIPEESELPEGLTVSRYSLQQLIIDLSGQLNISPEDKQKYEKEDLSA